MIEAKELKLELDKINLNFITHDPLVALGIKANIISGVYSLDDVKAIYQELLELPKGEIYEVDTDDSPEYEGNKKFVRENAGVLKIDRFTYKTQYETVEYTGSTYNHHAHYEYEGPGEYSVSDEYDVDFSDARKTDSNLCQNEATIADVINFILTGDLIYC